MKTHTITSYSFSELSENAKENAIENLYDINTDYEWWEFTYEEAKEAGLNINCFDLSRRNMIDGHLVLSAREVCSNLLRTHGNTCDTYNLAESTMRKLKEWENAPETQESEEAIAEIEKEFEHNLLEEYLAILKSEYEYNTSEEAIVETIKANEYEFKKDGSLFTL